MNQIQEEEKHSEHQIFTHRLLSSDGITTLVCHIVRPVGRVLGIVQISHGMCEYIGRYERFMHFLADHGLLVCGHDHLGHGSSCTRKDRLGFFGEENGHRTLVEDLRLVNQMLCDQFPNVPIFLFGHSMGSLVARLYMAKYHDELSGVILCGTAGGNPASTLGITLCNKIIAQKGPLYRPAAVDKLLFHSYNKYFQPVRTQKDWLTRDASVCDKYMTDPESMFLFTACGYRDLIRLQYYCNTPAWYRTLSHSLPCMIISGEMDPVGNYGRGPISVYRKMKRAGVSDLTIKIYPEARHELLNEINYKEVQQDILNFITRF